MGVAGVHLYDAPVGYSPPVGPSAVFQVAYNSRDAVQPVDTFFYSNLGKRWTHDWFGYIEDDPTALGSPVKLYPRGGGMEAYSGFVNGVSQPQQDTRAVLTVVSTSPIVYEREYPNGAVEVYSLPDGGMAPRHVFLTEIRDPQGNKLSLSYDSDLKLKFVTDEINQATELFYELPSDPLKITKVTDPFSRSAHFDYDDQGRLIRITDVIGLTSEFEYGAEEFIRSLTTPYGVTTFEHGTGPYNHVKNRWVQATDPLGGTERVEHLLNGPGTLLPITDPIAVVPTGFTGNKDLHTHLSVYYSKLAMDLATTDPPDPKTGEIVRFRLAGENDVSAYQIQSTKMPKENRVWYEQFGETDPNGTGPDGRPAMIGRVLDDGSSQIYRYEYNSRGRRTRAIDPVGRETLFEYAANEQDLLRVQQKNGLDFDLLQETIYNAAHQPRFSTDAAGQNTEYTYNSRGQIETITTPERAGITENRTTTYTYFPPGPLDGYLQSVTGPATGATVAYEYDGFGRTRMITDSDGYELLFDYDALDRVSQVTYPDDSFEQTLYDRLDAVRTRDRLGRWTTIVYDAVRRNTSTRDPLGRVVTQRWCSCGSLDALVDANGNVTTWKRDIQGRVEKEIRADTSEWNYEYELSTSRLLRVTDPKTQVKHYSYFADDNLQGVAYTNEQHETPDVSFAYDPAFNRVTSMLDGTGSTVYDYHPIGTTPDLGAGRLASVDGPLASDVITYAYDELGRVSERAVDEVALTYQYDALGRITTESNVLGQFSYQYDGVSSRLENVTYPNGQTSRYAYYPNEGDHRLQQIHHRKPDGATLSKFDYTYDAVGNILTWTQQQDTNAAKAYDFGYDAADQLRSAVWRTTDAMPMVVKRYGYSYDPAGNRTVEQIDGAAVLSAYDNMNRFTAQSPLGAIRFAGTLDEAATVTIEGLPATVSVNNEFSRDTDVAEGSNTVVVKATDYSGNQRSSTYEVSVTGSSTAFTFDANGNMTGDGTSTFEWDAENRLITVTQNTEKTEFTYDGRGLRTRILKTANSSTITDRRFIYGGVQLLEERSAPGTVENRFFRHGEQRGTDSFFYSRDHLESVREMTDAGGTVRAGYGYDPFGNTTAVQGSLEAGFRFAGYQALASSGLQMAIYRMYDPELGRWITEDPLGAIDDTNLYRYVRNNPVLLNDTLGLFAQQPKVPNPKKEPMGPPKPDQKIKRRSPNEEDLDNVTKVSLNTFCNDFPGGKPAYWAGPGPNRIVDRKAWDTWRNDFIEDCSSEDASPGKLRAPFCPRQPLWNPAVGAGPSWVCVCCELDDPRGDSKGCR